MTQAGLIMTLNILLTSMLIIAVLVIEYRRNDNEEDE